MINGDDLINNHRDSIHEVEEIPPGYLKFQASICLPNFFKITAFNTVIKLNQKF